MKDILVSAHNPMTGARHLGHFVSTIKEWRHLQDEHECFIVVDDLIAHFIYPSEKEKIQNRAFYTIRDFLAGGLDSKKTHVILTSMVPESLELMVLLSHYVDLSYCKKLYEESFCGMLQMYHRSQLGLRIHPSVAEFLYPQLALPALTLGLGARSFQGGEEISGYVYIMDEITRQLGASKGAKLNAPRLLSPKCSYCVGHDGNHMVTGNEITLAAEPKAVHEVVNRAVSPSVLAHWAGALDNESLASSCHQSATASDDVKKQVAEYMANYLKPFREFQISNKDILEILKDGAAVASSLVRRTIDQVKESMSIPVYI